MKTVAVAGNPVWERHLVPDTAHPGEVRIFTQAGGVWRLARLVRAACSDLPARVMCPGEQADAASSFAVWALYEQTAGSKRKAWRIREFLGTAPPDKPVTEQPMEDPPAVDVLVLEDDGLGSRLSASQLPMALLSGKGPGAIVWRTGAPLFESAFAEQLRAGFADRLTMVIPADALRARRAVIARALSWDRAVEDTVREFESGVSVRDLANLKRVVVTFGLSGAAVFSFGRLERFIFDPETLEGGWELSRPGWMPEQGDVVAASMVRHELQPASYPLCLALFRALAASRARVDTGGGPPSGFDLSLMEHAVASAFQPAEGSPAPTHTFFASVPHHLLDDPAFKSQPDHHSDLLRDVTGAGYEFVLARAADVVFRGPAAALAPAPRAKYAKYFTADREETERINAVRNAISEYRRNSNDTRPLSLAVFGPPGSGKSFAIKQLAAEMFAGRALVLEFNLSQFESAADLHTAFHRVRDGSVKGQTPLVFWDEFDSGGLRWLKEFLAPMQDAEFRSQGLSFPFGKAIFVFAGGTAHSFEEFDRTGAAGASGESFRAVKGPDFVSRLRGYVNIKGPNPTGGDKVLDVAHLIRRAIIFRSCLERLFPQLIGADGVAAVAAGVVNAFLRVDAFIHGARSLESLVSMSSLADARFFGVADLPSADLIRLHATPDFLDHARAGDWEASLIEALACDLHESWRREREGEGWRYGAERDEKTRAHPLLRPYGELPEGDKELSRVTARMTAAKLASLGLCAVARSSVSAGEPRSLTVAEMETMMRVEHDIWLRERLLRGYEYAASSDDRLGLHRDILPFDQVPPEDRELDRALVESLVSTLWRLGYVLAKRDKQDH